MRRQGRGLAPAFLRLGWGRENTPTIIPTPIIITPTIVMVPFLYTSVLVKRSSYSSVR